MVNLISFSFTQLVYNTKRTSQVLCRGEAGLALAVYDKYKLISNATVFKLGVSSR